MKKGRFRKAVAGAGTFLGIVTIKQERREMRTKELKHKLEHLDSAAFLTSTSVQASPTCQG